MRLRWLWPAWLFAAFMLSACGEPPNKEMDQAQGALDAAKAAGAERYATDEFHAATDALTRSREAVVQRDYRMALNNALDSRERAANSARIAADSKAQLRADIERNMAEIASLMADAHARLSAAERARVPRRTLRQSADAVAAADADVQKAGEAVRTGDYLAAQQALKDIKQRIPAAIASLEAPTPGPGGRRRAQVPASPR